MLKARAWGASRLTEELLMPLTKKCGPKARSQNIATERRAGKPPKQAAAIAYSTQRRAGCRVPKKKSKASRR